MGVRARVIVEGAFAGLHQNPHDGSSIEFSEHKEYAPGDDIRRIDWKAVGRVDRYYLKRFEDETEMRRVPAARRVGVDGIRAQRADQAGIRHLPDRGAGLSAGAAGGPGRLLIFAAATRQMLPPRTRGGHVRDVLAALDAVYPGGPHRPRPRAVLRRRAGRPPGSLIVLFSDLLDAPAELSDRLRQLRARGHDVALFHSWTRTRSSCRSTI